MAPLAGLSPKASGQPAQAVEEEGRHSDALPRMTPELLQSICKERQMWSQPHLNTQLFMNYKGFCKIESLEDYVNVKALHLDNNNIKVIEGLDRMTELVSLHLAGNCIAEIDGLESNTNLRQLNLEANALKRVGNLRTLVKLETINLSTNRVEAVEDLSGLKDAPSLVNVDVSKNHIETVEGVVEFWSEFKSLKVLRYHDNPGIRHISNYRKRIINAMPQMTYLDERPIFPIERKSCRAWEEGGLAAMHEAKREFAKERNRLDFAVDPERRELVTRRREMAIARLDREAKQREEREEKERRAAEAKEAEKQEGAGRKIVAGDEGALADYEQSWMQRKNLYGADGVRAKVAQEGAGQRWSKPQPGESDAAKPDPGAGFQFTPPAREQLERPERPSDGCVNASTISASARREQQKAVGVADFRATAASGENDNLDRQFAILGDGDACSSPASNVGVGNAGGAAITGQPRAADGLGLSRLGSGSSADVMPLLWEQRLAENQAAEAACLEQNMSQAKAIQAERAAGAAGFRSGGELGGLD